MNTFNKEIVYFNHLKFRRQKDGYFRSTTINEYGNRTLLHKAIYEKNNHAIPEGSEVHHIDLNKDNNNPSNLCIMTYSEHRKLHNKTVKFLKQRIETNKDPAFKAKCLNTKFIKKILKYYIDDLLFKI